MLNETKLASKTAYNSGNNDAPFVDRELLWSLNAFAHVLVFSVCQRSSIVVRKSASLLPHTLAENCFVLFEFSLYLEGILWLEKSS